AAFPRRKVCGCCLSSAALGQLDALGLSDLPDALNAVPLTHLLWAAGKRRASLPTPSGVSISREALDDALVREAVARGAEFLPETQAVLDHHEPTPTPTSHRQIILEQHGVQADCRAKIILAANGLAGRSFAHPGEQNVRVSPSSRVGAGTVFDDAPEEFAPGVIYMACHREGYLGLVRLEDGRLDVAGAFAPEMLKREGGPARSAELMLAGVDFPGLPQSAAAIWKGTPKLTHRPRRLFAPGVFLIGDAAGYVEPFTGEGVAWALASGRAAAPLALTAVEQGTDRLGPRWERTHRRMVGRRILVCRAVSGLLRFSRTTACVVGILSRMPALAVPIVRSINAPLLAR
ncbi:MAG: hypothetical protein N2C14_07810, partial [Planctomycetales bacterium]